MVSGSWPEGLQFGIPGDPYPSTSPYWPAVGLHNSAPIRDARTSRAQTAMPPDLHRHVKPQKARLRPLKILLEQQASVELITLEAKVPALKE